VPITGQRPSQRQFEFTAGQNTVNGCVRVHERDGRSKLPISRNIVKRTCIPGEWRTIGGPLRRIVHMGGTGIFELGVARGARRMAYRGQTKIFVIGLSTEEN